ncbi:hypothetical protein [Xenorhabdus bovienii]|uniref:hypothetical protein n=1 Tax=Xenorhabdus bovienii TaxID=40576 RepID=UPI0021581B31|nr:hypothetical protein [Xenorhabdus bovienii]
MIPILISALTSGISMAVFFTAISWFVEGSFHSTTLVSVVLSSGYILTFFILPKIGFFIDSNSAKKALNNIYILGLLNSVVFLFLTNINLNEIVLIATVIILTSIFTFIRSSDQVIRATYIKRVVSSEELYKANKNLELIRQGITFLSGGMAFFILEDKSISNVCIVSIFCFSISLFINIYVKKDNADKFDRVIDNNSGIKNTYKIGYGFFNGEVKRHVVLLSIFPYICVVSLNSIYPALFNVINAQIQYYALLVVPYGVGAIMGSLIGSKRSSLSLKNNYIIFGTISIIGLFLPVFFNHLYSVYLCLFLIALSHSRIRVIRNTIIMNEAGNQILGRLLSFNEMIFITLSVGLSILLGVLSDFLGFWVAWFMVIFLNVTVLFFILLSKDKK